MFQFNVDFSAAETTEVSGKCVVALATGERGQGDQKGQSCRGGSWESWGQAQGSRGEWGIHLSFLWFLETLRSRVPSLGFRSLRNWNLGQKSET